MYSVFNCRKTCVKKEKECLMGTDNWAKRRNKLKWHNCLKSNENSPNTVTIPRQVGISRKSDKAKLSPFYLIFPFLTWHLVPLGVPLSNKPGYDNIVTKYNHYLKEWILSCTINQYIYWIKMQFYNDYIYCYFNNSFNYHMVHTCSRV